MASVSSQTALFFRVYREVSLPLYAAMVADLCGSPHLPHELATTIEDIGQAFIRLADDINHELARRGVLDKEADPESTVEARIEGLLESVSKDRPPRTSAVTRISSAIQNPAVRQALKVALVMTHDLPDAGSGAAI